ncbi:MAG: hypothetical protein KBD78_14270 [Oligoflexales bacterium]|nr:hypothetical protein [Oligoflexales bacterium]
MSNLKHLKVLKKMGLESTITGSAPKQIKIGKLELQQIQDDLVREFANEISNHSRNMKQGILFKRSTVQLRRWLEKNEVSYVTEDGYLCLFTKDQTYRSSPALKKPTIKLKKKAAPKGTNIINPASLKLIETAIKMPKQYFQKLTGTELSEKLSISQSSVSKCFGAANVSNALEFREFVLLQKVDYWLSMMEDPKISRYLTPFFRVSKEYRFPEKELNSVEAGHWLQESIDKFQAEVLPGPLEVAKITGGLNDPRVTLWISPKVLSEFKKQNRLVPCTGRERAACALAVSNRSFEKEAIFTKLDLEIDFAFPSWMHGMNIFRAVWDLGFADSRARESRIAILQRLLNEIR